MSTIHRKPHKPAAELTFAGTESSPISMPYTRVNELCGPSRRTLALMLASRTQGPILWIRPSWKPERLNPQGVVNFVNPGRIISVEAKRSDDILWSMEEALRAGCCPTVIAECDTPPPLTPVRRLHLAAERGTTLGNHPIISLLLTPGDGGAQGIETRWHMTPQHETHHARWLLERRRARMTPPTAWMLDWHNHSVALAQPAPNLCVAAE